MLKIITSLLLFSFITITLPTSAATLVEEIAGVYKTHFKNELVSGEKYISEDILEIVPIGKHEAYVRMKLEFANGHSGDISGIAREENEKLVYYSKKNNCLVNYVITKDNIMTEADYSKYPGCTYYHGARGTLNGLKFPRKNKRTIRYMARLKASTEFKDAMQEFKMDK